MTTADREPALSVSALSVSTLSEPARAAMSWLEYLTQVLPDTPAVPLWTLMVRANLCEVDGHAVADELERAGLVISTAEGIAPTGKDWDRPGYLAANATFAYDLDDDTELELPRSWMPTMDALTASGYAADEYLMARLGVLAVIVAINTQGGPVTVAALRPWSRDPVDAVLSLIVDGLLPEQPHLAEELAEYRAYRTLSDIEADMLAVVVAGR